ncbi:hypothetical protein B0J15DRAFT_493844 [Fusarium solani]|uniref:Secreted protein n=1 Tax=Fusarium solani TaxID=169388 RepID=A0A9P9HJ78_FUSSL|nr:uncharacterized protein B0J15DRAFT_493844 [Fusarium solani]KAH7258421.1 hypothetical protein B0J15DRAFT_493844 [Fusarium solani]
MILCILWAIICSTCSTCSPALIPLLPSYPPSSQRRHDRTAVTTRTNPNHRRAAKNNGRSHQFHTVGSQPVALQEVQAPKPHVGRSLPALQEESQAWNQGTQRRRGRYWETEDC